MRVRQRQQAPQEIRGREAEGSAVRLSPKQRPLQVSSQLLSYGLILDLTNLQFATGCLDNPSRRETNARKELRVPLRPLFGRKAHCRSLGFARDDKGEGGDFYGEPLDRMDRKKQQDKFL
jgi:hypothetical protein